ncbi:ABC transporter substrate-binding protein [Subtercola boreus]|uniref:ABC transporter substrate-binding protein n=1 Tax=Subtercola boreus TaxID=120213 RepID=A0A3E0W8D3_9MICO|nr:ABC transporter substrate-binding protein [Subtercola boreus]RFA19396.1 ABC transporter substrate-binding protein [Subtercola boreus]RFA19657.1 ABC transporter substrate-binding protein [Subtercola boreus]RFA26022.1 ABC transporter substrate-binding protein [Subtercola boreus]
MIKSKSALRTSLLAGAGIIAIMLSGCASGGSTTSSTSSAASTASAASSDCASDATTADSLVVGTILPITGSLAYLNPPEQAGVGLAVSDINAAGGVDGKKACVLASDSGDSTDLSVSTASAQKLIAAKVSVAIGAASSSVSLNVVDSFASAKITEISPANTSAKLSGYGQFYYRTAPPDSVQGSALGSLITGDGNSKVAFLVFNDSYGTGLRDFTQASIESSGGTVVYGAKGAGQEFPPGQTTFSAEVTAALASKPDAIVVLAFDETKSIIPELVAQGWTMPKTYFSDGNTADYSKDFQAGTLTDSQGTIPGAAANDAFKASLVDWYKANENADLADFSYAPESYDATILTALAALKAKSNVSADLNAQLAAVSGASGGTKCTTYADCAKLVSAGTEIQYTGQSGIGPFNDHNEPSSAFIGIYKFDGDNKPVFQSAIEGQTSY